MAAATTQTTMHKIAYWTCLNLFLTSYFHIIVTCSQATINTLPGFNGTLPFLLETGYVNVGEANDVELFYYFIESDKDPENDPLILWLTGGPGCSSLVALTFENGPLSYDLTSTRGDFPSLVLNPYSWTKIASIIYLDAPVGTGFSYASSLEGSYISSTKLATDGYDFLRNWLLDHPKFIRNPLYICGDSYAGIYIPMISLEITKGNEAGYLPYLSLQGYVIGNGLTNRHKEENSRIQYAHRTALISDEYYKLVKDSCDGEYLNPDPNNYVCMKYMNVINECTANVNPEHILEDCIVVKENTPNDQNLKWGQRSLQEVLMDLSVPPKIGTLECLNEYGVLFKLANDPGVQQAIHIRNGTKAVWKCCNDSIPFERNVENVVEYHRNLSGRDYRALIYSGDHDLVVPYIATLSWIKSLKLPIEDRWRPWFVDGQTAGYTEKYKKNGYDLTFATVKGAGHIAIKYKRKECFDMVKRWFSMSQL